VLLYLIGISIGLRYLSKWLDKRTIGWEIPAGKEPKMW
jgi:hypothetical protein